MPRPSFRRLGAFLALLSPLTGRSTEIHFFGGSETAPELINYTVGTDLLWNSGYLGEGIIIANVEAGHFWSGHEVFQRFGDSGAPLAPSSLFINAAPGGTELGEIDFHATMVAHVLAGGGNSAATPDTYSTHMMGMAPRATLWSGAIATSFDKTVENAGAFEITDESFRTPYVAFFKGTTATGNVRADVINSSWGFDDPTYQAAETRTITGLAVENPAVAAVFSAGNSGYGVNQVGGPASSPNVISVGSLGGANWLTPSAFSSGGPVAFYNPATETLIQEARSAVHVSAPGEKLFLAAYLQRTGGLEPLLIRDGVNNPDPDRYFDFNQSGTSFSSPVVAGGIGLLKEVARADIRSITVSGWLNAALDTRVIRSLVMATALRTEGWDNGQHIGPGGSILTTQAVDYRTGAGAFNVARAALVYVNGTADVPGLGGGTDLQPSGWDFGAVSLGGNNDYVIDLTEVAGASELIVSLNWFVSDTFDVATGATAYGSFADLDLEVWSVSFGDTPDSLLAASRTAYDTTEFLRFAIAPGARYALRVRFDQFVYNITGPTADVAYGLSWVTSSIPEPAAFALLAGLAALGAGLRRRHRPDRRS